MSDHTPVSRLMKPTLRTKFHIDYDWWGRQERELRVYLLSHLCEIHRPMYEANPDAAGKVDWVDPDTAEIRELDGIQHMLISHCSRQPEYLTEHTSLVDTVFRLFLANGNVPLTPEELAAKTGRPATTILRTLSGGRVYKGLRPYLQG